MKTNINLELDDNQRGCLADWLDGKTTKRLATRKEVVGLVDALVMGIIDSHAADYPPDTTQEPVVTFEECLACAGLGCDTCDDGVVTTPARYVTSGPSIWETHPRLDQFTTEIALGLKAHGFAGTYQERSYRRGWTLESTGSNR